MRNTKFCKLLFQKELVERPSENVIWFSKCEKVNQVTNTN